MKKKQNTKKKKNNKKHDKLKTHIEFPIIKDTIVI